MTVVFYIVLFLLAIGWFHRYTRVKVISQPEYFLTPTNETIPGNQPGVTILIPARNEEKNIGRCVESLLAQDYTKLEIIVINDRSTDKTAQIVEQLAKKDKRVKLLNITSCPDGWSGKNHALWNGVKMAGGQFYIFTDADTYHYPHSVRTAVRYAVMHHIDMLSINPHLVTKSFWENVIMPIAGAVLMIWYPLEKINNQSNHHYYANGQFILFNKDAYDRIGGHEIVKEELLEDLALAQKTKQAGLRLKVLWGPELYQTHMYTSLEEIWRGWVRIFYHGLRKSVVKTIASIMLMGGFSILPYFLLIYAIVRFGQPLPVILTVLLFSFMYYILIYAYRVAKSNRVYSVTHFLGCLMVLGILAHTVVTIIGKQQITWRGTRYPS